VVTGGLGTDEKASPLSRLAMLAGVVFLAGVVAVLWALTPGEELVGDRPSEPEAPAEEAAPMPTVITTVGTLAPAWETTFPEEPIPVLQIDASGVAATGGTPLPDFDGAVPGDDGAERLALGVVTAPAFEDRLDFLYGVDRIRDAVFVKPDDPSLVSSAFEADRPFIVRHGFVNEAAEPLGDDFDVVIYEFSMGGWSESELGVTHRYTSDYVLRGETDQCGPTYRTQTTPVTCEWFVHEFPDGLSEGRHALWAFWEAPCSAWVDLGFAYTCADPDAVVALFASGVDSPWESGSVTWGREPWAPGP
jgi:hypothetical protein